MAELANPALTHAQAQAVADDVVKSIWPTWDAALGRAATLQALGRHFHIAPPEPPKLVIDAEMARQFADLVELFALQPANPRPSERDALQALIYDAIRERFDVRDH